MIDALTAFRLVCYLGGAFFALLLTFEFLRTRNALGRLLGGLMIGWFLNCAILALLTLTRAIAQGQPAWHPVAFAANSARRRQCDTPHPGSAHD